MRAPRTATGLTLAALVSTVVLAGCGSSGSSKDNGGGASAQAVSAGDKLNASWPLTGLAVHGDQSAAQTHPVMVLKMDNTEASAPQEGLGKADMVVEELVEGGLTRLAAFYYSQIPGVVGPVRSMRASDIGIVSPAHADVVTSGAANVTINLIKRAGIDFFSEGAKGFFRDEHRSAPYNLFTTMSQTATLAAEKGPSRPPDYLPWGPDKDFPKGVKATSLAATFSGGHTTHWVYQDGHYVNENTFAAAGDTFPADNVLVLRVQVGDAGYLDPAGNPVPETHFIGHGAAMIFHGGRMVRCQWSKKTLSSPVTMSTAAGAMKVPAGHTWIELVPANGGNVTFSK